METVGLRVMTKHLLTGEYDPYEYCFDGPGVLAYESEEDPIMTPYQYKQLWESDFEDLCFNFEDDWDDAKTDLEREVLKKEFIEKIKLIYETIMV
ncbi:hypothetical protein [Veillonella criceti]|uniref:Uncharacterized protein n=1 Tax=Veillonella criceti TaxID=103891 RepID=A0A380NK84_9FIRM|nr:hypothetical protein [Veillonella criceti]SUP42261.1 Uncharacterised protein [Veillonella criceti]